MQQPNDDHLERQLAELPGGSAPADLRNRVLAGVHGELQVAKWERRLARVAVNLLAIGIGLNVAVGLLGDRSTVGTHIASSRSQESLVNAAVAVAEATDPETGRQFARQLAAQSGRSLTPDQISAIDEAIERQISRL